MRLHETFASEENPIPVEPTNIRGHGTVNSSRATFILSNLLPRIVLMRDSGQGSETSAKEEKGRQEKDAS